MAVREGLLALLHEGPRYGYQLKTEFEAATGGVWPLNVGQVYTTLDRLERDGLVEVRTVEGDAPATAPGQKTYAITDDGVAELGAWWEAVPSDDPPPRDELMLKVLMAIDRGDDHALRVVTHQRTVLLSLLQAKRRERKAAGDDSLAARLVTDALVARAEADLRWLDTCEEHLQSRARTSSSVTSRKAPR
ncbi:MAG: helix-turn-helix transcriptional regulator [Acidimicrobiales bacterium]